MDTHKVLRALDSELRLEILKVLIKSSNTVGGVMEKLEKKGRIMKNRETVYRALEILVSADLVDKCYRQEQGIIYSIIVDKLEITFTEKTISIEAKTEVH